MKKNPMARTAKKCAKTSVAAAAAAMCMSVGIEFDAAAMRAAMCDMEAGHDAKVIQMYPEFDGFIA